jgi:anti-anti-sigma factor
MSKESRGVTKKIIKPGKKIVASIATSLKDQMLASLNQGVKEITVDFNGMETMDSKGLGVLIAAYNSLNHAGGKMKIKNASEKVYKFMQTTNLDKYFEVALPGK